MRGVGFFVLAATISWLAVIGLITVARWML